MKTNRNPDPTPSIYTAGGAKATPGSKLEQLRRSVLSCLLWEDEFYESGIEIGARIRQLAALVDPAEVASLAIEARDSGLRHAPLLLLLDLIARPGAARAAGVRVSDVIARVLRRADEPGELLSLYWKGGKRPLSRQLKVGLGEALRKFDAYQLAKYDRGAIRPRDVLFLTHPRPRDAAQAELWQKLADKQLPAPDTWEVALSSGADKRATWERLLAEGKLGYLALLRNLRNMAEVGVSRAAIIEAITARKGARGVLPFQYIAALRNAPPGYEPALDVALTAALAELPKLSGLTVLVVDISGSMGSRLSSRGTLSRLDAVLGLAIILREVCEDCVVFATAGNDMTRRHATAEVPARHGVALAGSIVGAAAAVGGGGIFITQVMDALRRRFEGQPVERIVVLTDEQDCGIGASDKPALAKPFGAANYMLNVASAKNGVSYTPQWQHVDGFSENAVRWLVEVEHLRAGHAPGTLGAPLAASQDKDGEL